MFGKKVIVSIILTVLVVSGLFGLYSDGFILGSYTYLRGSYDETFFQYLSEANYNCLNASIIDESIDLLYQKSDNHNLDIILHDHIWQPENEAVGVYNLTSSNNYSYEAEYSEIGETFPEEDIGDKYYYRMFRHEDNVTIDLGEALFDNDASNSHAWQCLEGTHNAGVVCDTLFWKWRRSGADQHVEKEILLPKQNDQFIMDTLYIEYQLKIDVLSHPDDTQICDLNFYISTKEGDHYIQNPLTLHSCEPELYDDNPLTVGEYNAVQSPTAYKTFTFYALVDDIEPNLIFDYDSYHPVLKNINFKVEWYGNGNLYLDCFRIYDDIYRKLKDEVYDNMLTIRVNSLKTVASNLKFMYGKDEPSQPQFDSYRLVGNILNNSSCDSLITALDRDVSWYGMDNYFHHELFEYMSEPEQIMFDAYPCAGYTKWNCSPNSTPDPDHIQDYIQNMMLWYKKIKELCEDPENDLEFLCIPQTHGVYYVESGHFNNPDQHWGSIRPPYNMQKCLQFLPLCYGADGIIDYKFRSSYYCGSRSEESNEPINGDIGFIPEDTSRDIYQRLALIDIENFPNNDGRSPQYYAIQEANQEINYIGPIVKLLEWKKAGTIDTNGEYPNSEYEPFHPNLESISASGEGFYSGFMECGEFVDNNGYPYFMFVNRRTEYSLDNYMSNGNIVGIPKNTDLAFYDAEPQTLTFHFTNIDENIVLLDQYTGNYYNIDDDTFQSDPIEIQPGDGMLLKLCQLPVPQEIYSFNSCTIEDMYIPYDVTIQYGGSLIINGNVEFGPNATLTIEEGGLVLIFGENKFGVNSEIIVQGELHINPQNLNETALTSKFDIWQGIQCLDGGVVTIENESAIEKAQIGILCYNGSLTVNNSAIRNCKVGISILNNSIVNFANSTIELKRDEDSRGIVILNSASESNIAIYGSEGESTISGEDNLGTGIQVDYRFNDENVFSCNYVNFYNLAEGIHYITSAETDNEISNCAFDYCDNGIVIESSVENDDEITECTFSNCTTGMSLNGSGCMKQVCNCIFNANSLGIQLNTFQVPISYCGFIGESNDAIGIELNYICEDPIDLPDPGIGSVHECTFNGAIKGIKCVNATPRITNCGFLISPGWAIELFNQSCIDMSWNSNNLFSSSNLIHIRFYNSGIIDLLKGHNDFWDPLMNDFRFANDYEVMANTINCNGNYWSDRDPSDPHQDYTDYIDMNYNPPGLIVADHSLMDDDPNCISIGETESRYEEAGLLEYEGDTEAALSLYESILTDQLEEEKSFWKNSIDRVFSLSLKLNENLNGLILFYDTFISNIPNFVPIEEKDELISFVKNYQKKVQIEIKNYQEAADIVVERIDNPTSPVDSLFAVMELENIYYLATLENGRSNVFTTYQQHEPEDCRQLQIWHDEHWQQINELLGIEDENENITIPVKPELYNNYPNPFNPETTISFSIPEDSKVGITIYNIKGQKVKTLVSEDLEKGIHKVIWDSKDSSGKSVSSGVYFYKLDVNGKTKGLKKMLLLK
ncbi:MAG: FlgD immunoglobulin-like domain containing protein [Candidatus Cloacimonadales bacterium]|nr:FlgD immunoglobulin-like domain containing protein [Candidatus Cloacimonadales bacterium]